MSRLKRNLHLGPEAFVGMPNIKLLQFESNLPSKFRHMVSPPEKGFKALLGGLRSFIWDFYPLNSFPLRSPMNNLVELQFTHSRLHKLWDGPQVYTEPTYACRMQVVLLSHQNEFNYSSLIIMSNSNFVYISHSQI